MIDMESCKLYVSIFLLYSLMYTNVIISQPNNEICRKNNYVLLTLRRMICNESPFRQEKENYRL